MKDTAMNSSEKFRKTVDCLLSDYMVMWDGALEEVFRMSAQGDANGLAALEEAIRIKSGQQQLEFYKVSYTAKRSPSECLDARAKILTLARHKNILKDPKETAYLLSSFVVVNPRDLDRLAEEVKNVGGESEFHSLQLVIGHLRASAKLMLSGKTELNNKIGLEEDANVSLDKIFPRNERYTFLVGAGISIPSPTSLPSANEIKKAFVNHMIPPEEIDSVLSIDLLRFERIIELVQNIY